MAMGRVVNNANLTSEIAYMQVEMDIFYKVKHFKFR